MPLERLIAEPASEATSEVITPASLERASPEEPAAAAPRPYERSAAPSCECEGDSDGDGEGPSAACENRPGRGRRRPCDCGSGAPGDPAPCSPDPSSKTALRRLNEALLLLRLFLRLSRRDLLRFSSLGSARAIDMVSPACA
jgi:hypothetical protein